MIERVHSIRGVGKLKNVSASKHKFTPLTLIYGENGRGKSTLTNIINSMKTNDTKFIEKLKSDKQCIKICVDGKDHIYENDTGWTTNFPNIEVFDVNFINENVVAGNRNESEHRNRLAKWIFGSERISLEKAIATLVDEMAGLKEENKNLKPKIEANCEGIDFTDFLSLTENPNVDTEIETIKLEIKALNDSEKLVKADIFKQVELPDFPFDGLKQLLETQLEDIAENAQTLVQEHLEKHKNISEEWLEINIEADAKECPYCGQSLDNTALLEAFQTYFSEAYKSLKDEVKNFRGSLNDDVFNERNLSNSLSSLEVNPKLLDFWNDYCEVSFQDIHLSDVRLKLDQLEGESIKLLVLKNGNLLEVISFPTEFQTAFHDYENIVTKIDEYNEQVIENNKIVESIKNVDITELPQKTLELQKLKAVKQRFQQPHIGLCKEYIEREEKLRLKQKKKTELNQQIKSTNETLLTKYGSAVERYLNDFSVDAKLDTNSMRTDLRGKETIEFEMLIGGQNYPSSDAFEFNLSEGDKSTVALAFFLARLDGMNLSNSIIVFDDPMSSQDNNRRQETRYKILELCDRAKQVIVLSHDALFLRELYRNLKWVEVETSSYQFTRTTDDYSSLEHCNILEMTKGEYFKDFQVVREFVDGGAGNPRDVTTATRRLIEEHIRQRFPVEVKQEHSLGNIIHSIVTNRTSKLSKLQNRLSDLNRINDFTSENGHGGSLTPSDGDARRYARLGLDIIENG